MCPVQHRLEVIGHSSKHTTPPAATRAREAPPPAVINTATTRPARAELARPATSIGPDRRRATKRAERTQRGPGGAMISPNEPNSDRALMLDMVSSTPSGARTGKRTQPVPAPPQPSKHAPRTTAAPRRPAHDPTAPGPINRPYIWTVRYKRNTNPVPRLPALPGDKPSDRSRNSEHTQWSELQGPRLSMISREKPGISSIDPRDNSEYNFTLYSDFGDSPNMTYEKPRKIGVSLPLIHPKSEYTT